MWDCAYSGVFCAVPFVLSSKQVKLVCEESRVGAGLLGTVLMRERAGFLGDDGVYRFVKLSTPYS